jgi:LmbE family N-acetylglucosaminyl deacetylase
MGGLRLMAVHAHPDDEVTTTGGTLTRYADEGVETVLVTCTNGEQGDGPGGSKPGEEGHDEAAVRERRLGELRASCAHLGIGHVELLGYRDSGMAGWAANGAPDAFANVAFEEVVGRVAELMRRYRPQVVVTYGQDGLSGHPDHVRAHRVTVAAAEATGVPAKLYFTAVPRSAVARFRASLQADEARGTAAEVGPDFGTPDDQITTRIDVSAYVARKRAALHAHASQTSDFFLLRLPDELLDVALGTESFVRRRHASTAAELEDDLFSGLR